MPFEMQNMSNQYKTHGKAYFSCKWYGEIRNYRNFELVPKFLSLEILSEKVPYFALVLLFGQVGQTKVCEKSWHGLQE